VVNEDTFVLNPTVENTFKGLRYRGEGDTKLLPVMGGQKVLLS